MEGVSNAAAAPLEAFRGVDVVREVEGPFGDVCLRFLGRSSSWTGFLSVDEDVSRAFRREYSLYFAAESRGDGELDDG